MVVVGYRRSNEVDTGSLGDTYMGSVILPNLDQDKAELEGMLQTIGAASLLKSLPWLWLHCASVRTASDMEQLMERKTERMNRRDALCADARGCPGS